VQNLTMKGGKLLFQFIDTASLKDLTSIHRS